MEKGFASGVRAAVGPVALGHVALPSGSCLPAVSAPSGSRQTATMTGAGLLARRRRSVMGVGGGCRAPGHLILA